MAQSRRFVHPLWMRITHSLNAVAFIVMLLSGWRIYNAAPLFAFTFAPALTLGGWLGGALQWHFAAMWLLMLNGALYLALCLASGRLRAQLLPVRPAALLADARAALRGRLAHDGAGQGSGSYNALQKLAYLAIIADLVLLVLSGLAIWKPVQLPLLTALMNGYDSARVVHFAAMAFAVLFLAVHLAMVALVPRTLLSMFAGKSSPSPHMLEQS